MKRDTDQSMSKASLQSLIAKEHYLRNKKYDPAKAVNLEKLNLDTFKKGFFDHMEKINYSRVVDGVNFKRPVFLTRTYLKEYTLQ